MKKNNVYLLLFSLALGFSSYSKRVDAANVNNNAGQDNNVAQQSLVSEFDGTEVRKIIAYGTALLSIQGSFTKKERLKRFFFIGANALRLINKKIYHSYYPNDDHLYTYLGALFDTALIAKDVYHMVATGNEKPVKSSTKDLKNLSPMLRSLKVLGQVIFPFLESYFAYCSNDVVLADDLQQFADVVKPKLEPLARKKNAGLQSLMRLCTEITHAQNSVYTKGLFVLAFLNSIGCVLDYKKFNDEHTALATPQNIQQLQREKNRKDTRLLAQEHNHKLSFNPNTHTFSVDVLNNANQQTIFEERCATCLNDYSLVDGEYTRSNISIFPCRHFICTHCADGLLERAYDLCPLCRHHRAITSSYNVDLNNI